MGGRSIVVALAALARLTAQDAGREMEVVHVSRSDGGRTIRFDPGQVEKNYQNAANALKQAFSRIEKRAIAQIAEGYDAGLPDPVRTVRRTWKPSTPLPRQIRGVTIFIVTVDRSGIVHGLPKEPVQRTDIVCVSRAARLGDCMRLGTVTLLTRPIAESLGIRTSRARCVVSADGTEIEITEGDTP